MAKGTNGDGRQPEEQCTFCSKTRRQVRNLIAGPPGVYICNECIEICNSILQEEQRRGPESGAAPSAGAGTGAPATSGTDAGRGPLSEARRLPTPIEIARFDHLTVDRQRQRQCPFALPEQCRYPYPRIQRQLIRLFLHQ